MPGWIGNICVDWGCLGGFGMPEWLGNASGIGSKCCGPNFSKGSATS